ncbi:MAG: hypothetical protein ABIV25_02010 [Paracoccaceae bacterium]
MQLQLISGYSVAALGVGAVADGMALIVQNGAAQLIYSERELNAAKSLSLVQVGLPGSGYMTSQALSAPLTAENQQPGSGITFQYAGTAMRAFLFDSHSGALTFTMLSGAGVPAPAQVVTTSIGELHGVQTFAIMGGAGGDVAVLSNWNTAGVSVFNLGADGALGFEVAIADTPKSYLANVSDTATVTLQGQNYLLTLSSLENGLTCYAIGTDHQPQLVDSLGNHDGLWVNGPAALQTVQLGGVTYAIIASTVSSSLSVVRVNDMGCLFVTDHVVDDLTTRFAHPEVLDTYTLQGRVFAVSAGTDAGITVMELLPGGHLSPFLTVALETGQGLYPVTGLEVALNGTSLDIFVVESHANRIQKFGMSLANLGPTITGATAGTAKDDLILGKNAAEVLKGGAGDDWLHSGGGADTLTGGSGADVFVFDGLAGSSMITDYELHSDRIDVSDWGNLYSVAALAISATGAGCTVSYGAHQISIVSADGHSLSAAGFGMEDFIF